MALLEVNELRKEFNGEDLFHHVSFNVNKGEKVALIGNNGVGKTTILKMILGEIDKDGGTIHITPGASVGYLSQVMISSFDNTLHEEMLNSFKDVIKMGEDLKKLEEEIALDPSNEILIKKYGNLETRFLAKNGYDYEYLISLMTSKFGFTKDDYDRKISSFSGGERNKIAFTKLLLNKPDLLILDEPTNHLDMSTIEWLEEYLRNYEGSVVLVTHDRYFIDAVCDAVIEIANHTSSYYSGNYTYYLDEKVLRYQQQLLAYNLQEKEIERLKLIIEKNIHKSNQRLRRVGLDRQKKLARIENNRIEAPQKSSKQVHFNLKTVDNRKVRQFTTFDLTFGYDYPLINNSLNLQVFFGDKIGIIGPNGTGKTTLLKTLACMLNPLSGKIQKHRELRVGYVDQNQIQITSTKTVFDYFHDDYPHMSNFEVRHLLGSFLFIGEDVFKTVDSLSGGEKVRLSFAKLMLKKYDILLLDEPTNHLDMETRKVLENALREYIGTIIFVSHDRYFITELAEKLIIIENENVKIYEGDYEQYKENVIPVVESKPVNVNEPPKKIKTKTISRLSKEKLEAKINKIEQQIEDLKELMYEEEYYTDQRKMDELDDEITTLKIELDKLMEEYLSKDEEKEG